MAVIKTGQHRVENEYLNKLHKKSSYHRNELFCFNWCGCFYCRKSYRPSEIKEWTDLKDTAICPRCGIDSVLPMDEHNTDNINVLNDMYEYWFGWGVDSKGNEVKIKI